MKTAALAPLSSAAAAPGPILETAAALYCAIQRLTEQEPGPQDPLFIINNFQLIAAFGRARVAFHKAMGARPNVHTDMFVPQTGDLKIAGETLMQTVTSLAITANGIAEGNSKAWEFQQSLPARRTDYLRALEDFGTALGYPVYDPGALSYNRKESDAALYFD